MLYELFMYWVVGSITVIAASMVFGGLLCVWCAYRGSKRSRQVDLQTPRIHQAANELASSNKT